MLEKNKDYIEMRVSSTDCAFTQNAATTISIEGFSYDTYFCLPDPGESYVIVSKEKFEKLQIDNEQLKKKLAVPDPFAEYKELFEKLRSKEDVEKFEWNLNHICGGQVSVNGWMVTSKLWRRNYETLSKLVGFSSVEEIQDYLTNEAECNTLQEAISKLKDQVKYTCDEWHSANSNNNSWKVAAECNSPKELIEKIEGLEGKVKVLETEAEVYSRALQEWKEGTGCPSPSAAKNLIESGASWHQAYKDVKEANEKLADNIRSWKNVTGYSTPEDYMHARINCATPFDYTSAWQAVTGCSCPKELSKKIVEWEKILTPHMSARDLCSAMSNAIDFDKRKDREIESAREALRASNLAMQKELENNIDEWQKATGCNSPEAAETIIRHLRGLIDEHKEFAKIASNWMDRILED